MYLMTRLRSTPVMLYVYINVVPNDKTVRYLGYALSEYNSRALCILRMYPMTRLGPEGTPVM